MFFGGASTLPNSLEKDDSQQQLLRPQQQQQRPVEGRMMIVSNFCFVLLPHRPSPEQAHDATTTFNNQ